MLSRRAFLILQSSLLMAGLPASRAAASGTQSFSPNLIFVGNGGDFPAVAEALASINDNARTNPYLIYVLPGVYPLDWTTKEWVSVIGFGPLSTLFQGSGWEAIQIGEGNLQLAGFGIRFTGDTAGQAAIRRTGTASGVYLSDIHIEHSGAGAGFRNQQGDPKNTWWLRDMKIRSEGIGLDLGGTTYCDNLKVLLYGQNSGQSHIGCKVTGNYVRVYLNNCRMGTGYWADYESGAYVLNEVYGDDDVAAIWMAPGFTDSRVEVHGLESFCRNEDTVNPSVNVNVMRVDSGWLRAFGCFGQSETPANWGIGRTLFSSGGGKIEQYACRFTNTQEPSWGSDTLGVQTLTVVDDGYVFDKFEGGLHRLDASSGDFSLVLRSPNAAVAGEVHIFKKINPENTVTVNLNGATLEGSATSPVLSAQYDELKIIWDGNEWLRA